MKLNEAVLRKIVREILNENSKQGLTPAVQKRLDNIVALFKALYAKRKQAGLPLKITGYDKSDWLYTGLAGLEDSIRKFYVEEIDWLENEYIPNLGTYRNQAGGDNWYKVLYPSVVSQLDIIAKQYGWRRAGNVGDMFIQYSKPTSPGISRSERRATIPNNKMYMTFVKGSKNNNFKELRHNLSLLGKLLKALHAAPTVGCISFKFDDRLMGALSQTDNLVIYFDDPADKMAVEDAAKSVPFILKDRSKASVARNVFGKDEISEGGSDSYVAARQAVRNLFANASLILNSPNPSSIVLKILEDISLNASHRT